MITSPHAENALEFAADMMSDLNDQIEEEVCGTGIRVIDGADVVVTQAAREVRSICVSMRLRFFRLFPRVGS